MNTKLLLILPLALAACASGGAKPSSGGPKPAWVEGESPRFPRSRFIVGVGSADDENAAAERARGEIARVFNADVTATTGTEESETSLTQDGKTKSTFAQHVSQQVQTVAKKALEGSDVVERWKDPASGRFYALAALPKAEALLAVTEKLHSLDEEASTYKAKLDAAGDRFEKAKAAAKLSALLKARAPLESEHRVLGGGPAESSLDAGAARSAAAAALAALNVVVSADGDGARELTTGLVAGLNASGLSAKPSASGGSADLLAESEVAVAPVAGGDPRWKWSRATATVSLKEGREGKVFSRFELAERQASADAGEARRRALKELSQKAADKVQAAVAEFFENQ
jgi:hypothetical protein